MRSLRYHIKRNNITFLNTLHMNVFSVRPSCSRLFPQFTDSPFCLVLCDNVTNPFLLRFFAYCVICLFSELLQVIWKKFYGVLRPAIFQVYLLGKENEEALILQNDLL